MKKLILLFTITLISSCSDIGTRNPGYNDKEIFIQVDTNIYKVLWVTVSENGGGFYLMVPENSNVNIPETLGFKAGKTNTSIIKINR